MLIRRELALVKDAHLVTLFAIVPSFFLETDALQDASSIPADFIKLIVSGFDAPCLETLE